jgi:hypothetical protein
MYTSPNQWNPPGNPNLEDGMATEWKGGFPWNWDLWESVRELEKALESNDHGQDLLLAGVYRVRAISRGSTTSSVPVF